MKRIAATVLALALAAASGSAFANHTDSRYGDARYGNDYGQDYGQDYGDDARYRDSRYRGDRYDMAQVISVDPIFDRSRRYDRDGRYDRRYDDRNCRDDRRYADPRYGYRDSSRSNGAALGAIVGGALGNQAGKGDGRKAATIAGAVIGGVIGAEVADNNRRDRPYADIAYPRDGYSRCDNGYGYGNDGYRHDDRYGYEERRYEERVIGYNVTYRYAGRNYRTRMDHHPGRTIRVRVDVRPDGRRFAMGL